MACAPKDVDAYIASAPKTVQGRLQDLRAAIMEAAPDAVESISYGMPYYACEGRLCCFSVWKEHIGLYAFTGLVIEKFKNELAGKIMPKGTIQFPHDEELPVALIKKLVKAQAKENEKGQKK